MADPQTQQVPEVGAVEDGYKFKGGDPSKTENWEQVQEIKTDKTAEKPPGFINRFGSATGIPTSMAEAEAAQPSLAEKILGPTATAAKGLINYGKRAYQGIKEGGKEAYEAGENIGRGGPILPNLGKAAYGWAHMQSQATPFIGPAMETASEDIVHGNYPGAAGGLAGVVTTVAAPKIIEEAGPAAGKIARTGVAVADVPTFGQFSRMIKKVGNIWSPEIPPAPVIKGPPLRNFKGPYVEPEAEATTAKPRVPRVINFKAPYSEPETPVVAPRTKAPPVINLKAPYEPTQTIITPEQATKGAPIRVGDRPSGRYILSPEEVEAQEQQMEMARQMARQRGMQYAAGIKPIKPKVQ